MKCPKCHADHARLSWLREFTMIYWCPNCHAGFEVSRHQSRPTMSPRPEQAPMIDGVVSMPAG
jgi:hypothetical protein